MTRTNKGAGPFPRRIFIPDERIDRQCRDALAAVDLLPQSPQPIRIERFIYLTFRIEEEYEHLPPHIMGCAKFTKEGLSRIVLNRSLAEDKSVVGQCRVRSTLAHEAGHGLFHNDLFIEKLALQESQALLEDLDSFQDSVTAEGFACRAEAGMAEVRPFEWWEYQANLAMAALLLPLPLVSQAARDRLDTVRKGRGSLDDRVKSAEHDIAEVFNVSRQMVSIRLNHWWKQEIHQPTLL